MTTSGAGALQLDGYGELLADLKLRVRATQFRAARAANTEVLRLHWSIGHDILERQAAAGWGSKVVTRLAADLHREFPDQRGWSRSNLLYMRRAAETWPTEAEFVHHVGGRLPWRHVTALSRSCLVGKSRCSVVRPIPSASASAYVARSDVSPRRMQATEPTFAHAALGATSSGSRGRANLTGRSRQCVVTQRDQRPHRASLLPRRRGR